MKKGIVTILGMINGEKAEYDLQGTACSAINIFSLLVNKYASGYEIRPIATEKARDVQQKVLERENLSSTCLQNALIVGDLEDYDTIFRHMNELISEYDEIVIDVSHGFRHLPILLMITLVIQNTLDSEKIRSILFAKEVEPGKKYEVIDLAGYLDLSTIAFTLSRFSENYTVSNNVKFRTQSYQELVDNLGKFSQGILANSLNNLIASNGSAPSLVERIVKEVEKLQKNDLHIANLSEYLKRIIEHMNEIRSFGELKEHERLYRFAKLMHEKWYLLNAITLLNEAIGFYCLNSFGRYDPKMKKEFDTFMRSNNQSPYYAASESSMIVKKLNNFDPEKTKMIKQGNAVRIISELEKIGTAKSIEYKNFAALLEEVSRMRNNLAHANSGEIVATAHSEIKGYLQRFEAMCIGGDVLKKIEGELPKAKKSAPKRTEVTKSGIRKKV